MVSNMTKPLKTKYKNFQIKKSALNVNYSISEKTRAIYNDIIEEEDEMEETIQDPEDLKEYNHLKSLSVDYLTFVSDMKIQSFNYFFLSNVTSDDVVKFVRSVY